MTLLLQAICAALMAYAEHKKLDRARMLRDALDSLHEMQHKLTLAAADPGFSGAGLVLLNARLDAQRGFIRMLDPNVLPPRPKVVSE